MRIVQSGEMIDFDKTDVRYYDRIMETGLLDKLLQLKSKRAVRYLITHVLIDEIAAIPDDKVDRRQKLFLTIICLQPEIMATEGVVLGASRLGFSKFGDSDKGDLIRKCSKKLNPSRDALIGLTALGSSDVFVSNDQMRTNILKEIINKEKLGTKVMTFEEFEKWLNDQLR